MRIIKERITADELMDMARVGFGDMINIRPSRGNLSRGVDDAATRESIEKIVASSCSA